MPQIELNDQVFQAAQRRATAKGYGSVNEYIAAVVIHDLNGAGLDFDHVFTPERLADLEQISAEIKAGGKTYSIEDVEEHFQSKRKAWLAAHPT